MHEARSPSCFGSNLTRDVDIRVCTIGGSSTLNKLQVSDLVERSCRICCDSVRLDGRSTSPFGFRFRTSTPLPCYASAVAFCKDLRRRALSLILGLSFLSDRRVRVISCCNEAASQGSPWGTFSSSVARLQRSGSLPC